MNITLRDYDDVYFSITPLTRYVIQRAYRLDMDMDAEGVALYLKMRADEFAHKLDVETIKQQIEHDGIRQEMKDMAAKVTRTRIEDDYRSDVPEVDISAPARDIMEQLDMTADELPAPSPEESWLLDIGAIALSEVDDDASAPMPPDREGEWYDHKDDDATLRHLRSHITITRPVSEAGEFDIDITELLALDYVVSSETAMATNNGPRLFAFMVAREFYRR